MNEANKAAITKLKSLIDTSSDEQMKLSAIAALGEAGGAIAVTKLKALINTSKNKNIQLQAIAALGRAGR